jgi:hypothetical protein
MVTGTDAWEVDVAAVNTLSKRLLPAQTRSPARRGVCPGDWTCPTTATTCAGRSSAWTRSGRSWISGAGATSVLSIAAEGSQSDGLLGSVGLSADVLARLKAKHSFTAGMNVSLKLEAWRRP